MDCKSSSPLRSPTHKNSKVKTVDNGRGDVYVSNLCNGASTCDSKMCTSVSLNGDTIMSAAGADDPETSRLLTEEIRPIDVKCSNGDGGLLNNRSEPEEDKFTFRPVDVPEHNEDEYQPLLKNVPALPPNGVIKGFTNIKNNTGKNSLVDSVPQKLTTDNVTILQESLNAKQPKSIVKTTSENTFTFGSKKSSSKTSLSGCPDDESKQKSLDSERPVLHVQFEGHDQLKKNNRKNLCPSPTSSESSSSSSSEDDSSVSLAEARAPDGGWGWVVVFASFMVNLIADGVTFSFGVIYVHFLEYFGEGKAKTAWIGSLFMAMPLLSGPVASFLTDRYGCRYMTILGSILASAGFIMSAFVNNMEVLFFTFGIMAGFGLSLCYVAAVVIVAYYFEKKRSLATGLSVCGSGIGTFIFAPLTQILLDEYGWRGTTLILAGLFLNMAVCGTLMRDLPWTTTMIKAKAASRKKSREQKRLKRNGSTADSLSDSKSSNTVGTASQLNASCEATSSLGRGQTDDRLFSSLVNLPTFVSEGENVPIEVLELMSTHKNVYNVLMQNYPNLMISSRSFSDSGRLHELNGSQIRSTQEPLVHVPSPLAAEVTSPMNPTDKASKTAYLQWLKKNHNVSAERTLPYSGPRMPPAYLKDLRVHRQSLTYRGAMLNISRYRLRASSCPNIYRNSMTTIAKEKIQWYAGLWDFWDLLVDMLDFSHFSNPKFLLFSISNFLLYTWYDVPYVYIADSAIEMGFSETDSSMLISTIGIVNMVGEIFLGWAGDWEWIDAGIIYAICMFLCGAVTALIPLLKSYVALSAASGAFGLFIAANYSLTSIILVELITLEKFTNAYGLLLLVQGIANLIGPPLAGWIYDLTGNYDSSFYCSGAFIALSGVFLVILPANKKFRKYRALKKQNASASTTSTDMSKTDPPLKESVTVASDKNDGIFV